MRTAEQPIADGTAPALRRRTIEIASLAGVLVLAAAWPLSAYAITPALLPGLIAITAAIVLTLHRIEFGIAIVLALLPLLDLAVELGREGSAQLFKFTLPPMAAGLFVLSLLLRAREAPVRAGTLVTAVAAFLLVSAASTVLGSGTTDGVGEVLQLTTAAFLMLATLQSCRRPSQLLVVVGGVVAALLIASLQGLFQQATGQFSEGIGLVLEGEAVGRIAGSFGHPNQYAGFLAVLMPLAGALAITRSIPTGYRLLGASALLMAIPALMFSYTRGALAALVLGAVLWLGWANRRAAVALVAVGLACLLLAAPAGLAERFENVEGSEVTLRSDLWASALDIFAENPVIGVGFSNFEDGYSSLSATEAAASQRRLLHQDQLLIPPNANNLYLTILAEEGILGLLALLAIGAVALNLASRGMKLRHPLARAAATGLGAGTLVLALHSMLEVTLVVVFAPVLVMAAVLACSLEVANEGADA